MKLGTEVGLGLGHILLDGDPGVRWGPSSPPQKEGVAQQPPNF